MRSILWAVARRVGAGVAVLWAAATAAYAALWLAPGDTIDVLIGDGPDTPEIRAAISAEWGLDRPEIVQYLAYLGRLLQGDLGRSYWLQRDVGEVLASQLRPSVELVLAAAGTGVVLALLIAVLTAGRGPWPRRAASAAELVSVSVPPFVIGILLLTVFSFTLGWFPVSGADGPAALVLPALALGLPIAGVLGQVLRDGLERALEQPFAVTARARGLGERAVVARHALRHALLPAVTYVGWFTGSVLGGAVITEILFGRPGLGQVTMDAVSGKDLPVVMAVVILFAAVFVAISTVVDLAYRIIDPRLRTT
ncbi:peptide/nickel transport system permease protein [Thermocatellispora tengchongensis]|uniref:Peptide/nickel transport system permease protein n=1 Tax=Thermocatellispora tengchongensis TaxID=1073253 RepID=A0A840PM66_9ACTN|nr:ABC transporter permease [Thermocatellispora tengchongensis]MBB5138137.1 peptide/nickel transport system permease protein [Thermocatellispora tengchongensis]